MLRFLIAMDKTGMRARTGWELEPLSPRSVVLSVLLGAHPPAMPVRHLLEFTALFGFADGTVRTALSRLVKAGDLATVDGVYQLRSRLVQRQRQQDSGRVRPPATWDGTWWFAAITAERRSVTARREFRTRAVGARLGELRPELWIRPGNIDIPTDLPDAAITRGPLMAGHAHDLVERLWNLDELERTAARLLTALDDVDMALHGNLGDSRLPDAFTMLAACQRFLRSEPQLPVELSTRRSADQLRERYDVVVDAFQRALEAFFDGRGQYRRAVS